MTWASLLILVVAQAHAAGPSAEVSLRASTTTAALGQPVAIEAIAAAPEGTTLELDAERSATDYFSIGDVKSAGAPQKLALTIQPLALGKLSIDLYWTLVAAGGRTPLPQPSRLELDVAGPAFEKGKNPEPFDIKEPRRAHPAIWPWILAALIGAGLWELYRRRKQGDGLLAPPVPVDDRPAEVIALSELDALEHSRLWPEGRYKDFYFNLTELLRQYLERRYGMPATKLTTSELYKQVREAELDRPLISLFKDVFERADLVKFAKIAPDPDWGAKDIAGARTLVQQTTPRDEVAAAAAPEAEK